MQSNGRGGEDRTPDLTVPNRARYHFATPRQIAPSLLDVLLRLVNGAMQNDNK